MLLEQSGEEIGGAEILIFIGDFGILHFIKLVKLKEILSFDIPMIITRLRLKNVLDCQEFVQYFRHRL